LVRDLQKIYKWLSSEVRQEESARILRDQYAIEPLFLNVDNLYSDNWQWCYATQLVFNNGITDEGRLRPARTFLSKFKPWLLLCGAIEVKRPEPLNIELSSPEHLLSQQREVYSSLRDAGCLIDVSLVGLSGEEVLGHKIILAAFSPVLLAQFTGDWNDNALVNGITKLTPGYSVDCLQHCLSELG
jgi:hypothetical protein